VNENAETKRVAVIAGASGLVGTELLQLLLQSEDYQQVVALVRRPLELTHPNLRQITVMFGELPQLSAFTKADVFCALGTTLKQAGSREAFRAVDYDAALAFAQVAAGGAARQFMLVSSIGANARSNTFYLQVKGELEEGLKPLPFQSLHIFRPSFLVGNRPESRPGERLGVVVAKALEFAFVGKLKKYSAIDAIDLAAAMLAAAHRAEPGVHTYEYEQILALAKARASEPDVML
jgi:uncharacterized protein YbjT (DUF2867 family)